MTINLNGKLKLLYEKVKVGSIVTVKLSWFAFKIKIEPAHEIIRKSSVFGIDINQTSLYKEYHPGDVALVIHKDVTERKVIYPNSIKTNKAKLKFKKEMMPVVLFFWVLDQENQIWCIQTPLKTVEDYFWFQT